jgi:hypothetical protein
MDCLVWVAALAVGTNLVAVGCGRASPLPKSTSKTPYPAASAFLEPAGEVSFTPRYLDELPKIPMNERAANALVNFCVDDMQDEMVPRPASSSGTKTLALELLRLTDRQCCLREAESVLADREAPQLDLWAAGFSEYVRASAVGYRQRHPDSPRIARRLLQKAVELTVSSDPWSAFIGRCAKILLAMASASPTQAVRELEELGNSWHQAYPESAIVAYGSAWNICGYQAPMRAERIRIGHLVAKNLRAMRRHLYYRIAVSGPD